MVPGCSWSCAADSFVPICPSFKVIFDATTRGRLAPSLGLVGRETHRQRYLVPAAQLRRRCDPDRKTCERMTAGGPCSFGPFGHDCLPGAYCQDFTCELQQANGASCESALACQSVHCDPVEHVCADAPACGP